MTILVLGGQGNLGTQLTKIFHDNDYEVVSWDREDFDALDFPVLKEKIFELRPTVIINAIAYNAVDRCEDKEDYEIALKLNCDLPGFLADLALALESTLIHYSTDYVFSGVEEKQEFTETDTPNPINKYGESKFLGEQEVLKRKKGGLKYYLIRTSKLFGPSGKSAAAKPSFFDIMLEIAQNKGELTVVNGELSCFTYTPDLALATKKILATKKEFGIYHLTNAGPVTWYGGVVELLRLKGIKVNVRAIRSENLARAARRPEFSVLKNTKVNKLRSWKEALKEYICVE